MNKEDVRYHEFIKIIADEDTRRVLEKDKSYGASRIVETTRPGTYVSAP